jgi:SNF2 family DNA or RNA helicase
VTDWLTVNDQYAAAIAPQLPEGLVLQTLDVDGTAVTVAPRDIPTVSALRRAGHNIASLEENYAYPGRFPPMAHQRETVRYLLDHERAGNLSDPGTGKTLAAVWAADALMREGMVRRVLVVAPKTILLNVWGREFFSTLPRRPYAICYGSADKKRALAENTDIPFIIVNYESLHLLEGSLPDVDLIIADEATKIKTPQSKRTQALQRIAKGKRLWLLTGTPAPQAPTDAYMACRLLREGNYMSFRAFQDLTMVKVSQFVWKPRANAAEIVARELQPSIRFRRDECLDLPEQQIVDLEIEPSPAQKKAANEFIKQAWADLDGQKITAVNAGVALSKALQVLSGGVYHPTGEDDVTGATAIDAKPLMETITTIIDETEGPVLIFAPFRISAAVIHARLLQHGVRSAMVTGAVTDSERVAIFDQVQNGTLDAMVAIPQTVSHGLTLTTSNTIIWVGPTFSFETYEQANARINRKGQTRKSVVFRISQLPLTKALYRRLDERATLQDTVLRLMEGRE